MDRRTFFGSAVAAALGMTLDEEAIAGQGAQAGPPLKAGASPASPRRSRKGGKPVATFVLVHGAFHGGWCYTRVVQRLREHGHDVYAPTLSGLGERAHFAGQAINLSTHIQDVVAEIETNDLRDVVLCGHSYGGMVITGAADRLGRRVRSLFYLDAPVPENGQSLFDIVGPARTQLMLGAAGSTGTMIAPFKAEFFNVHGEDAVWVEEQCTPHPIATFIQKLHLSETEPPARNHTYVLCERYKSSNHETYGKVKDRAGWKVVSLDRGHDLMVTDPELLAGLLMEEALR